MEEIYKKQLDLIENIISTEAVNEHVLRIEGTCKIPFILLDSIKGIIYMKGAAVMDDSNSIIRQILDFIDKKFANVSSIEGHFMLTYCNSSFGKALLDLFIRLKVLHKRKINVICYWYYDEDDEKQLQEGEDYESCTGLPFVMIEITD